MGRNHLIILAVVAFMFYVLGAKMPVVAQRLGVA